PFVFGIVWSSSSGQDCSPAMSNKSGSGSRHGPLEVTYQAAGIEHGAVGKGERLYRQRGALRQVAHLVLFPIDLDLVPTLDQFEDAGAARLRKPLRHLSAPVTGRKGFR